MIPKSIGGYFELELPQGEEYHKDAIRLNTARNAFEYVLRAKQYIKVYLPYYMCDVMLEPIEKLKIDLEFYSIDENFAPVFDFSKVKERDVFVYTNYFGIGECQVQEVSRQCKNLIVDNSQAFFSKPLPGVDTLYSARKFFGLPDGAYLYTDKVLETEFEQALSLKRFEHLLGRFEQGAEAYYNKFKENDDSLIGEPIKRMSNLTRRLLQSVDYNNVELKRRNNFLFLHNALKSHNQLQIEFKSDAIPMVYPYLVKNGTEVKKDLLRNKIFVASYWPNVLKWADPDSHENYLTRNCISIPVDQRYDIHDLMEILKVIHNE